MARRGTLLCYVRAHATLDQPLIPGSWDVTQEANRWCTIYPLGRVARPDVSFHCRLMIRRSGFTPHRALFVCVGLPTVLQHLADRIAADGLAFTRTWASLAAFRADAVAAIVTLRSEFPDERPHLWTGPPGALVDGGPIGTLVALHSRMAGFGDDDGEGE